MIHLEMNGHSRVLRTGISVQVLLPDPEDRTDMDAQTDESARKLRRYPVLYLLHELSGDENAFLGNTSLARYLAPYPVIAVMPRFGRSFGVDQPGGPAFGQFLAWELPSMVEQLFPAAAGKSQRFVAGVDAGGYAAFRLALAHPERYAAAAALSAPLNPETLLALPDGEIVAELTRVFGAEDTRKASGFLLDALLAEQVGRGDALPRLLQLCGKEDFFLQDNQQFARLAGQLNAGLRYREMPGEHDWETWDAMLPHMLQWMFG